MGQAETKPLPPPFDSARPGRPLVVSHRAGGNEAPENTLAALRNAQKAGSKVMQMDVLQTADGTPVVYHDPNMLRGTGVDIAVKDIQTASDLPPLKAVLEPLLPVGGAQSLRTDAFPDGQRIPLLKELLQEADEHTYLLLEIWEQDQALVQRVVEQVREAGRAERVILGNPFNAKTWEYCKAALPEAPTILPLNEVFKVYAFYMFGLLSFWTPPAPFPVFNIPLLTDWHLSAKKPQQIGMKGGRAKELAFGLFMGFLKWLTPRPKLFLWLQKHGIPVVVFILNRPQDWDYALSLEGITAIQTDNPTALRDYLAAREAKKDQ